jgi:next to BRCA1 gene 1 protein
MQRKVSLALFIPFGAKCLFERYSDSAASYVVLDKTNTAVYKQLHRAAKAKQKLKLRVTTIREEPKVEEKAESPKISPKTVSIEEVPDESKFPMPSYASKSEETLVTPAAPVQNTRPVEPSLDQYLDDHLRFVERNHEKVERDIAQFKARVAELQRVQEQRLQAVGVAPLLENLEESIAAPRANFAVCCNLCDRTVPDSHYHCSTCEDGDFDLCQTCVDKGLTCYSSDHWLIKRFVKDGAIINSTTERIAPKKKVVQAVPEPQPQCSLPLRTAYTVPQCVVELAKPETPVAAENWSIRTCNNCVAGEHPHSPPPMQFVTSETNIPGRAA